MAYKLRFVQRFQEPFRKDFLELERKFADLEKEYPEFPKGRRFLPYAGREPKNTFIWECEFETLDEAQSALSFLDGDPRHESLFQLQSKYFVESYTEIYETFLD